MALIKYYNLESRSWEEVSDLERNLQKHLLSTKNVKGLLTAPVDAMADIEQGNGDSETLNQLVYDSGEFDVLYKKAKEISPRRWKIFSKNILENVGVELVVKANEYDILGLQDYLTNSGFEVIEARGVALACYKFYTQTKSKCTARGGKKIYEKQFTGNNFGLEVDLKINKGFLDSNKGYCLQGFLSGQIEKVLRARRIIGCSGSDLPIYSEGITFY